MIKKTILFLIFISAFFWVSTINTQGSYAQTYRSCAEAGCEAKGLKCQGTSNYYSCTSATTTNTTTTSTNQSSNSVPVSFEQIQSWAFPGAKITTTTKIGEIISSVLPYIFGAAGIALLIYLVLGGFQIMFSQGDPKAVQGGQSKITNAIVGFIIVFFAFSITQLVGQILGIKGTLFGQIFGLK